MAVHRRRSRRRAASPPRLAKGTYKATLTEGDDLGAAAGVIADEARRLAGAWSSTVPDSIQVEVSGRTAVIYTDAGPAYPNEVPGVKHPTYGHRPWVTNQHRPFLGPAADAKASEAMERFARKYDRLLAKAGFRSA
jgi:hypothetical protein